VLRRLARAALAHGLAGSGADRAIARISGVAQEPLVLAYHRVLPDSGAAPSGVPSMGIRVSTLERHLEFVGRRFHFVSLDELGSRLEQGTASRLAALTFDDGYLDFYERAFPLLQRKGIPGAVFVVTDLLDEGRSFLHDRVHAALESALSRWGAARVRAFLVARGFAVAELPDHAFPATRALLQALGQDELIGICMALEPAGNVAVSRSLTWDQLVRMSRAGITVGSHTRSHVLLPRESAARVREETTGSRAAIEARLGLPVTHFVYPDGCFDAASVRAVAAAGYRYAYTGCRHRDPVHPLLTVPRRVLWEGSTLGALGHHSADVLSGQVNGIFEFADPCRVRHGATTVALVAPSLDVIGGQSVQAVALAAGLREAGLGVLLVATNPRFPAGLRWLRKVPVARTFLNQALYAVGLLRLHRADVVHAFSASFWSFLLAPVPAMLVGRLLGKRVVLNYHSGEAQEHLQSWGWLVHPWLRLAHQIVVPSEYLQRVFAGHGLSSCVVRNVVDTARFGYRARTPLRPWLLSTRNLEPCYGVGTIVEAFALLRPECPDATLAIAGSGSEEKHLRRMAAGLGGVSFLGQVAPAEMPRLCDSADVFVNASLVDNQPLSLLEALASGLPVVTTAPGGIAALVRHGETGLVVPPRDPAALALAVLAVLRDEAGALRRAAAGRQVAQAHAWAAVREQWLNVYSGGTVDAGPRAEDGDRRAGRPGPSGSLEVAGEERYAEPVVAPAR
jgi:glycosyltransferase involved in cell wall biosynthesis/peptidoglycan/xylan/chitin deacetylase (PgdA/CDA1 family)